MNIQLDGVIGRAIADYTGAQVLELEAVVDPVVAGAYGIQALVKSERSNPRIVQFVISGVPLRHVTDRDLQEVEFDSWPPRSGR